jgi:hypothetical protein
MTVKLKDMSLSKQAIKLSTLGAGLQALVNNIINESNDSDIKWGSGETAGKQAFFNHGYDKDPATNGGALGLNVKVSIYYQPSTKAEYDNFEVVDKAVGLLSGRRRLAVRVEDETYSFYTTNHPKEKPGLRTNVYGVFTPIDPKK